MSFEVEISYFEFSLTSDFSMGDYTAPCPCAFDDVQLLDSASDVGFSDMQSDNTTVPATPVLSSAEYPELSFKDLDLSNYSARVAYDIGSGATKVMGGLYNTQTGKIDHIFSNYQFPMTYSLDMAQSGQNQFSDLIMEIGMDALREHQTKVHTDFAELGIDSLTLEEYGTATAAFRKAENAQDFVAQIDQELHIPIEIISQKDEGILGYQGAMLGAKDLAVDNPIDLSDPIVWDIGGGSLQLVHQSETGDFDVMEGTVASGTFQALVNEHVKENSDHSASPNPINFDEFRQAQQLAHDYLSFDPEVSAKILPKIEAGGSVYAIGSVHNFSIQTIINKLNGEEKHGYTKSDVLAAAHTLIGLSDQQIADISGGPVKFADSQLTNLILIHAVMEKYGIKEVTTLKVNNTQGLIANGPISKLSTVH